MLAFGLIREAFHSHAGTRSSQELYLKREAVSSQHSASREIMISSKETLDLFFQVMLKCISLVRQQPLIHGIRAQGFCYFHNACFLQSDPCVTGVEQDTVQC